MAQKDYVLLLTLLFPMYLVIRAAPFLNHSTDWSFDSLDLNDKMFSQNIFMCNVTAFVCRGKVILNRIFYITEIQYKKNTQC